MNKTKIITLSLVLVLVLMGTAFAWWTQSTTISNQINTGSLKIELEKTKDILGNEAKPKFYFSNHNEITGILDDALIRSTYKASTQFNFPTSDTVNFVATNMFPGSKVAYSFAVKNTGTVPVKIEDVELLGDGLDPKVLEDIIISFKFVYKSGNIPLPIISPEPITGTYNEIAGLISETLKNVVLLPEDTIELDVDNGFVIEIPEDWESETQDKTIDITLKFNYKQANK